MRTTLLALVPVLLAGCVGGAQEAPSSEAAPTTPASGSAPEAFQQVRLTHDHAQGMDEEAKFIIPPNAGALDFLVYFEAPGSACVSQSATIAVTDPSGDTKTLTASMIQSQTGGPCYAMQQYGTSLEPGEWTALFSGRAVAVGIVEVRPSQA